MINKKLTPFKLFCSQNFPFIEEDFDALTNYELMCKIVEYLNNVINEQNITGENVNNLINWFNNLDVQDEVNNKLDAMAESGELADIMENYGVKKLDCIFIEDEDDDEIQAILNRNRPKIIVFNQDKIISKTLRLNANTELNLNNHKLAFNIPFISQDWTKCQGFYNFNDDDEFLGYNGNGNIKIINGTIEGGNCSFIHANNIRFENVNFKNIRTDHILEMCAINGLYVENCHFEGTPASSDITKEYIQLDNCTYANFPHFSDDTNPTYDNTLIKNVYIKNSEFVNPTNSNFHFSKAIGMHSFVSNQIFENIIIENNKFNDMLGNAIELINVRNVKINNNKFYKNGYTTGVDNGSMIKLREYTEIIEIANNVFDGNINAIETATSNLLIKDINIYNNKFRNYNFTTTNYPVIRLFSPRDSIIKNNIFENYKQCCLQVDASPDTDYDNMVYLIDNNIFRPNQTYYEIMLKLNCGRPTVTNNNFDTGDNTVNTILRTAGSNQINKLYMMNNSYSQKVITEDKQVLDQTSDKYYNVYNCIKKFWEGNTNSLIDNANNNINLYNFNTIMLTMGAGNYTQTIKIRNFSQQTKMEHRTWKIPVVDSNGGVHVASFTLNENGSVTFTTDIGTIPIREIYAINEL